jgi:hypothetical protein
MHPALSARYSGQFTHCPIPEGDAMKAMRSITRKFKAEKSLKAYAWYIWY